MASPQKEHGFTPIANELLRAIIRQKIPARRLRIWLALAIDSYGKSRKETTLSIGEISKMTGIDRSSVAHELRVLLVAKMTLVGGGVAGDTRGKIVRKINKDYDTWVVSRTQPSGKDATRTSVANDTTPRTRAFFKKEKNISPTPYQDFLTAYNENCGKLPKALSLSKQRKEHIAARWSEKPDLAYWVAIIRRLANSSFAAQGNWAGFDWVISNDTNHLKVAEGKYDDRKREPITGWI